jgi:hypothetical protein
MTKTSGRRPRFISGLMTKRMEKPFYTCTFPLFAAMFISVTFGCNRMEPPDSQAGESSVQ